MMRTNAIQRILRAWYRLLGVIDKIISNEIVLKLD
jgi:hypothetical protein